MEKKNIENNTEKDIGNIVECIYRVYRIQTPDGLIVEVESDKHLSAELLQKLLEEDEEVNNFFKCHTILAVRRLVRPPNQLKTTELGEPKILIEGGIPSPRQRLNLLLQMKGEFTRQDYIKFLDDNYHIKLKKWTSHNDIQEALQLNRIKIIEGKVGKLRKYRVIDAEEIGESLYNKLLEDRKLKMGLLT